MSLDIVNLRWFLLFFLKWEDVHVHSSPIYGRSIKWRNSEERQLMKWVGIFQVGIFRGGFSRGGVWWVGIFRGGFSRGNLPRTVLQNWSIKLKIICLTKLLPSMMSVWLNYINGFWLFGNCIKTCFCMRRHIDIPKTIINFLML